MTDIVVRASRAKALLNDPTYQDLVAGLKDEQTKVFLNAASTTAEREEAHKMVCALMKIEARLHSYITDEKILNKK